MKCTQVRKHLLDFLYDELPDEQRTDIEEHLSHCAACRGEETSLRKTMGMLEYWEDVDPKRDLIFVDRAPSLWQRVLDLSWLPHPVSRTACITAGVVMACLILLSALHTELTLGNGTLSVKMHLFGAKQSESTIIESAPLAAMTEDRQTGQLQTTAYVMESILYTSEQRQRRDVLLMLGQVFQELQGQRQRDMMVIQRQLYALEHQIDLLPVKTGEGKGRSLKF